jgi:hypothetical protein
MEIGLIVVIHHDHTMTEEYARSRFDGQGTRATSPKTLRPDALASSTDAFDSGVGVDKNRHSTEMEDA